MSSPEQSEAPDGRALGVVRSIFDAATIERAHLEAFDEAPVGTALVGLDEGFPVVDVNGAMCALLSCVQADLVGRSMLDLFHGDDAAEATALLAHVAAGARFPGGAEVRLVRPSGDAVWALLSVAALGAAAPRLAVLQFFDIDDRKAAETLLQHSSLHDPLTGLANRRLLMDRIGHALARAGHEPRSVVLFYCDLDGFKEVNDSLGHDAGDALLVEVARRLEATVRPGDTVARLGGDEFAVLAEDVADSAEAETLAVRLAGAVAAPVRLAGQDVTPSASVGLAAGEGPDPVLMLRSADQAMYRTKLARRHGIVDHLRREVEDRLAVEVLLRKAVAGTGLHLHYQPVVDLGTGRPSAVEAFARLDGPDGELLAASRFVGLAAELGLIAGLGARVLAASLHQLRAWRDRLGDDAPRWMSVNLSRAELSVGELPGLIASLLSSSGLTPAALVVEAPPAVLLDGGPVVGALHRLGVGLAADDMGSDVGLLPHLASIGVRFVKIDLGVIGGLGAAGTVTDDLVHGLIRMSRALGLRTIAEGVERPGQTERLTTLGCDYAQGHLFGAPAPASGLLPAGAPSVIDLAGRAGRGNVASGRRTARS